MCCGLSAVEVLPGALSNVPILQCVKPRVKSRHQHGKLLRAQLRISVYIGTCMCKVNAVGSSIGPDVSQPLPQLVFVHSAITVDVESSWARLVRAQFATAPSKVAVSYGHLLLKFSCDQILHVFRKVGAKRGKVRLHGMACRSKVDLLVVGNCTQMFQHRLPGICQLVTEQRQSLRNVLVGCDRHGSPIMIHSSAAQIHMATCDLCQHSNELQSPMRTHAGDWQQVKDSSSRRI
mmetsp:Transcript_51158/g.119917  ORF Transcript_51158/g.119917 Transcript_51158/m.119917 type:complete len:234 (-) Transcript_51158:104-805(-)